MSGERYVIWNMYRDIRTGKWNHQFLRICAVARLFDCGCIDKARAIALLAQRKVERPGALVELWIANPRVRFSQ